MKKNALTLKVLLAILVCDITSGAAQLCMKKGLTLTGIDFVNHSNILDFVFRNACSPMVWLGILIFILTFFLWIVVLSRVDLSVAIPLSAANYVIIPTLAMIFLKEQMPPLRWIGIFVIITGVFFISKSARPQAPGEKTHA